MNTRIISSLLAAAGSLALLVAGAPASATAANGQQITRYDGGSCRPTSASSAEHFKIDNLGRLFNTSPTDFLGVDCPLVRDFWGSKSASVRVYVFDQKGNPNFSLSCTFQMYNPATGQVHSSSLFLTSATPSAPSAGVAIESKVLTAFNMASLHCLVPPAAADGSRQSGIGGYDYTEIQ